MDTDELVRLFEAGTMPEGGVAQAEATGGILGLQQSGISSRPIGPALLGTRAGADLNSQVATISIRQR